VGERLEEFRCLGIRGAAYRLGYEFYNRTRMRRLAEPVGVDRGEIPEECTLARWRSSRPGFLFPRETARDHGAVVKSLAGREGLEELFREAGEALRGKIRCFSRWPADFGDPVDWHRNPRKGVSWPSRDHWSAALSREDKCGDVKLTWEINRFPHLYAWVRAYSVTSDPGYVRGFVEQLSGWESANPYRAGVNWASGQEVAIRGMAWIFALYAFADDAVYTEEDFRRLLRLIRLHGEYIEGHIDFSRRSVRNNHLIGEALGLYLIGGCFPWFREAGRWKAAGRSLLEGECIRQFREDGGYCQSSHNYHRLALHYYLWACRLGECWGEPFPSAVYETIDISGAYFASFLNERDGRLPNWGANDGALLNPWTFCDYSDFRPVLSAVRYLTSRKRAFPGGPWDEELLWLYGPGALHAPVHPYPSGSKSFPVSGLHVLRASGGDFGVLRCGRVTDRFGQADQLHLDLWWKGLNVAMDGGSFLYNDEPVFHRHFMGTSSHNTVAVDGRDQMLLYRRFKWLYWTDAKLLDWVSGEDGRPMAAKGEHSGYRRLPAGPVVHSRSVSFSPECAWTVEDRLLPERPGPHVYRLHWLLADFPNVVTEEGSAREIRLATPAGELSVRFSAVAGGAGSLQSTEWSVVRGDNGPDPRGWISRYYGERLPAFSVSLTVRSEGPVVFLTRFSAAACGAAA